MARTPKINTQLNTTTEEKVINYIPLTDNYYFSVDSKNYILYYFNSRNKIDVKTKKQTSEILETYDIIGFYSDLENLIKATVTYLNKDFIIDGQAKTLKDCVNQIRDTTEKLMAMLK